MDEDSISSPFGHSRSTGLDRSSDLSMVDRDSAEEERIRGVFPTTSHIGISGVRVRPTEDSNPVRALSQEQLEDHDYQKKWNNTLHTYPGIEYVGICTSSAVNRLQMNANRMLKRKMEVTNSNMSPSRKQHITEEKMAACMQGLSLENEHIRRPTKNINNDSDFEDDSDIEEEDIEDGCIDPVFELHVDLKDYLKKLTTIVPGSVVAEMKRAESANLAVVPYIPRDSLFLRNSGNNNDEKVADNELPSRNNTRGECLEDSKYPTSTKSYDDTTYIQVESLLEIQLFYGTVFTIY